MRKVRIASLFLVCAVAVSGWSVSFDVPEAHAARLARILRDSTPVYRGPGTNYPVTGNLNRGDLIATSNNERNGFYRVKSKSGVQGFVQSRYIWFGKRSGSASTSSRPRSRGRQAPRASASRRGTAASYSKYGLRVFGSYAMTNVEGAEAYLDGDPRFRSMMGFGGEFGISLAKNFQAALRLEKLLRAVNDTNGVYNINLASMPVMLGGVLTFVDSGQFSMDLGAFGGLGLSSQLSSENLLTGARTEVNGSPLTFLGKVNMNYSFNSSFALFAEAGYRMMKMPETAPDPFQSGTLISNQNPVELDMSGLVFGLGVGLRF